MSALINEEEQGLLINLVDLNNDDYSITLAITIYVQIIIDKYFKAQNFEQYNFYMNQLFRKIDALFLLSYHSYVNPEKQDNNPINDANSSRMAEKSWFVRYYVYYLTKRYNNFKDSLNKFHEINQTRRSNNEVGYKSQLNWNFIKTNKPIDKFYDLMLENNVKLFYYEFTNYY